MLSFRKAIKSNRLIRALTGFSIKSFILLSINFFIALKKSYPEKRNVKIELGRPPKWNRKAYTETKK